jgi:inner membrane protein
VTRTSGGAQELVGPILTVSSIERWEDTDGKPHDRTVVKRFLPRTLSVRGRADIEVRRRGIFDVPLFVSQLHVEGTFLVPDASQFAAKPRDILWHDATLAVGVSDPRSIRAASPLSAGARRIPFEPGPGDAKFLGAGLHVPLPNPGPGTVLSFAFDLTLAGSGRLTFVPVGDETVVALTSSWPDPSFDGAWLPVERRVSASGFDATWRVLNLGRNFPSTWVAAEVDRQTLSAAAFGVTLLSPVDTYRTNDRAVKYQLLFIGLTFLAFTLFELLARLRVHPFQYLLVGLALCLFYLLLLSLSEQIGFARAYEIAAAMVVGLVTTYVRFVLARWSRALAMGALLGGLYGFLFVLLQIQDYALLVGSLGLFVVLATIMWITRRVNWYDVGASPRETA